jgi:hypothetical protein
MTDYLYVLFVQEGVNVGLDACNVLGNVRDL